MTEINEWDIGAMRAEGSLAEYLRLLRTEATEARARRKALVLRYPDLAQRLTEQPMNYPRADQWNGSIPPAMWNGVANDSPLRPALLQLVAEAEAREAVDSPPVPAFASSPSY